MLTSTCHSANLTPFHEIWHLRTFRKSVEKIQFSLKSDTNLVFQSALQPLWVLACSTILEYSQQEGFYRAFLPASTSNPQIWGPMIRTFQLPPPGVPMSEKTRAKPSSGRWNHWREIFREFCRKWILPHHFCVL